MVKPEDINRRIEGEFLAPSLRWAEDALNNATREAFVRDAECYEDIIDYIKFMIKEDKEVVHG